MDYIWAYLSGERAIHAVLVVCLCWLLVKLVDLYKRFRKWEAVYDALPGSQNKHWFYGNLLEHPRTFGEEGLKFQVSRTVEYPRFHRVWITRFICFLVLHHPDTIKVILRSSAPKPRKPGSVYVLGIEWLGEGLLIANGQRWARNRRLLTPAFHFEILQPYVDVVNSAVDILIDKCNKYATSGETVDAFDHVGLCSLDIILRCAFSYISNCQAQGEQDPYVKAVHRLSYLWMERSLKPSYFIDWYYFYFTSAGRDFRKQAKIVHDVADSVIQKRKENLAAEGGTSSVEGDNKRRLDFLDILLTARDDNDQGLTDPEIRNEVDTFLFEGHDTTTSAMAFTLLSLARHPGIQARVQQEVDRLMEGRDTEVLEWKDLAKLEYMTLCIKESMRIFCPVFFVSRETSEDLTLDGYHIPAGTTVAIDIHNLHHNQLVWGDDHNEFKPERFTKENFAKMNNYAFLPFSAGPRNCIGQNFAMMEMKIVLAKLLRKFTFEEEPGHVTRKMMGIVMRAENGLRLKVRRRTDT